MGGGGGEKKNDWKEKKKNIFSFLKYIIKSKKKHRKIYSWYIVVFSLVKRSSAFVTFIAKNICIEKYSSMYQSGKGFFSFYVLFIFYSFSFLTASFLFFFVLSIKLNCWFTNQFYSFTILCSSAKKFAVIISIIISFFWLYQLIWEQRSIDRLQFVLCTVVIM